LNILRIGIRTTATSDIIENNVNIVSNMLNVFSETLRFWMLQRMRIKSADITRYDSMEIMIISTRFRKLRLDIRLLRRQNTTSVITGRETQNTLECLEA